MTYSLDFRKKALAIRDREGLSLKAVAERFGISQQTVYRWTRRLEAMQTRDKPATRIDMGALVEDIKNYKDAYQYGRAARLGVSQRCVGYALARLGVSYKKNTESSEGLRRETTYIPREDRRI